MPTRIGMQRMRQEEEKSLGAARAASAVDAVVEAQTAATATGPQRLVDICAEVECLRAEADVIVAGRRFRIVSDFNGQSCGGRSRPSLRGKEFAARCCLIEHGARLALWFDHNGETLSIWASEVEWID